MDNTLYPHEQIQQWFKRRPNWCSNLVAVSCVVMLLWCGALVLVKYWADMETPLTEPLTGAEFAEFQAHLQPITETQMGIGYSVSPLFMIFCFFVVVIAVYWVVDRLVHVLKEMIKDGSNTN
jgi:hypothetical protein